MIVMSLEENNNNDVKEATTSGTGITIDRTDQEVRKENNKTIAKWRH